METKWRLLEFLIARRREGKRIAGYGAPGKGNTLLNYCGIRTDLLDFTVDRNPYKQGQFLPGTHIPIRHPDALEQARPGLHPDPALEPEGRDRGPARARARMGRAVRRPDPGGGGPVKVVIFCGGQGLRMREASEVAPKPMIPIGPRPVLWHVMKYYAHFGFTDFVLCLGYKAEAIKHFFLTYSEAMANDFVLSDGGASVHLLKTDIHNWNITFVDTGLHNSIGQRLRAVREHLGDDELFLANYGDTLTDADLPAMIERAEVAGATASFLAVRPNYSFHVVSVKDDGFVGDISDVTKSDIWINGGYFVLRTEFLDQIAARRGHGGGAVPAPARRAGSCWPSATRASGPRWTR